MHSNLDRALEQVLKHEGGYVNHPNDPGGPTNLGVTLANFKRYVKPSGTIDDLKKLTREQAKTVFTRQYWDVVRGNDLPSGLDFVVFDFAVNSGPSRAVKFLQKIVNTPEDGVVGPETLGAVAVYRARDLITRLCDDRLAFMRRIRDKNGKLLWDTFGKGWLARVNDVRARALTWAAEPVEAPEPAPIPAPVPDEREEPQTGIAAGALIFILIVAAFAAALWFFTMR